MREFPGVASCSRQSPTRRLARRQCRVPPGSSRYTWTASPAMNPRTSPADARQYRFSSCFHEFAPSIWPVPRYWRCGRSTHRMQGSRLRFKNNRALGCGSFLGVGSVADVNHCISSITTNLPICVKPRVVVALNCSESGAAMAHIGDLHVDG